MKTIVLIAMMLFAPFAYAEQYISVFADTTANARNLSCTGNCAILFAESKNTSGIGYGVYKNTNIADIGLDISIANTSAIEFRVRKRLGKFAIFAGIGKARMDAKTSIGSFTFKGQVFVIKDKQDVDMGANRKSVGGSYDINKTHGISFSYHRTEGKFDFSKTLVVDHGTHIHNAQIRSNLTAETSNYRISYLMKF